MRTVTRLLYFDNETEQPFYNDVWSHKGDFNDYIDGTEISVTTYHVCSSCGQRDSSLHEHEVHEEECYDI